MMAGLNQEAAVNEAYQKFGNLDLGIKIAKENVP
jgi:hypothetical protein